MKHRKLRIAWSVAWGIATLLLVALWIRSYWQLDILKPLGHEMWIARGRLTIDETYIPSSAPPTTSTNVEKTSTGVIVSEVTITTSSAAGTGVNVPIGVPALVCASLSTIPWITLRFSLRTMLLATTIIAAALGLIVWFQ